MLPRRFISSASLYLCNGLIARFPCFFVRHWYYRSVMGFHFARHTSFLMSTRFSGRNRITIGNHTIINWGCWLDNRGDISIGNNVSVSPQVMIITADHDLNCESAMGRTRSTRIADYVFIGTRATLLPGIEIGKGAVIAAGSVVLNDVGEGQIVGGVPAKIIGHRPMQFQYQPSYRPLFQ